MIEQTGTQDDIKQACGHHLPKMCGILVPHTAAAMWHTQTHHDASLLHLSREQHQEYTM